MILDRALHHITEVAKVPSFSSYEERLHPYIHHVFKHISGAASLNMPGNNVVYKVSGTGNSLIALTAHLDKINHYGKRYPSTLPVKKTKKYIEGAMDDSAGVGILLAIAELAKHKELPDLLFFSQKWRKAKG